MFPRELYLQHLAVCSEKILFCQTVMAGVLPYKIKRKSVHLANENRKHHSQQGLHAPPLFQTQF